MTAATREPPPLDLVLNEEQRMLFDTARKFVASNAPVSRLRTLREASHPDGFSRELWKEVAELGWLGLQIPETYGGLGLGFFDLCAVLEATGRELMPEPWVSTLLFGVQTLMIAGNEEQKSRWLPAIGEGNAFVTLVNAETERDIEFTPKADGFVLHGTCPHVRDAHVAEVLIVAARSKQGVSLFAVDPSGEGVVVERQRRVDLHQSAVVSFADVRVPKDALIGVQDEGNSILSQVIDRVKIGLSAQMLGASERAFEMMLEYLKQREQFGALIGSFQALQHRAARLYIEISLLRSAVLAAARSVDERPEDTTRLAALAKALCSETGLLVAKEAIQMHGGIGVTDEHDIGFYIKRAQAVSATLGNATEQRKYWAELNGY